jgi:patatin-like phospholipase/acyl hydrolase
METYRIITFDGGGIRGIYTLTLLRRLQKAVPDLVADTHFLAGTSTGSLIALGMAAGLTVDEGIQLYRRFGAEVFQDSFWDDLRDLFNLIGAEYSTEKRLAVVGELFGDLRLQDLSKRVLVPAFDLDGRHHNHRQWKAKIFHNFPGADSDGHVSVVDVAMASTAAPTYFPVYKGYIDGGVVANNPSMLALAQVMALPKEELRLTDVRLLSLGTGRNLRFIPGDDLDWGLGQWAKPIIPLILEGVGGVADFQCRTILGDKRYHRLNPVLLEAVNLDGVNMIDRLVEMAEMEPIEPTIEWLRSNFFT